jgi:DNA-binding transcriptional ArsR family regulator
MLRFDNPYDAIKSIFHEPNRLAIMSALCNTVDGLTFNELKEECGLTDGNLSRHLRALEEARAIKIKKSFVRSKPLTTVSLTERGRGHFLEYLQALEEVLKKAADSVSRESVAARPLPLGKAIRT